MRTIEEIKKDLAIVIQEKTAVEKQLQSIQERFDNLRKELLEVKLNEVYEQKKERKK